MLDERRVTWYLMAAMLILMETDKSDEATRKQAECNNTVGRTQTVAAVRTQCCTGLLDGGRDHQSWPFGTFEPRA